MSTTAVTASAAPTNKRRQDQHPAAAHERTEDEAEAEDQQADGQPGLDGHTARKATPAQISSTPNTIGPSSAVACGDRPEGAAGGAGVGRRRGGCPTARSAVRRPHPSSSASVVGCDGGRRRASATVVEAASASALRSSASSVGGIVGRDVGWRPGGRRPRRGGWHRRGRRGSGSDRGLVGVVVPAQQQPGAERHQARAGRASCRAGDHQSPQITLTPRTSSTIPKIWVARSLRSIGDCGCRRGRRARRLGGHEDPGQHVGEGTRAAEEQHDGGDAHDHRIDVEVLGHAGAHAGDVAVVGSAPQPARPRRPRGAGRAGRAGRAEIGGGVHGLQHRGRRGPVSNRG